HPHLLPLLAAEGRVLEAGQRVARGLNRERLADAVVLARADRDADCGASGADRTVDRGAHRLLEHLPGAVATGSLEQEVADVLERYDLVGDDPRVHAGDLVLAPEEQPVELDRPDVAHLDRL